MKNRERLYHAFVILVLTAVIIFLSHVAHSQSDRKINRNSKESGLYVRINLVNTVDGVYNSTEVYCGEELVTHFINHRHFIAHTSKFELDLDVKDRKVGEYNSWIAKDRDKENYYFITPFKVGTDAYGVIIQPCMKNLSLRYDEPVITIANVKICQ